MDPQPVPTTPMPQPDPTPQPQPIPQPAPAPMPMPAPAPPPKEGFFDGMTLVDWGMLVLASAGLISAIWYFGSKISNMNQEKTQTQKDINELKTNLRTVMGGKYQSA